MERGGRGLVEVEVRDQLSCEGEGTDGGRWEGPGRGRSTRSALV